MRVAFVHPDYPGAEGTGATHTATVLVRSLSERGHDVTAFCRRSPDAADGDGEGDPTPTPPDTGPDPTGDPGPVSDRSPGVERRYLATSGFPPHTATLLNRALRDRLRSGEFDPFDVVHSYLPTSLPALGEIGRETDARTVLTLNAYGAVCPKNDLRYMDESQCRERGPLRCTACSLATSTGHDDRSAAYYAASRIGNLRQVRAGLDRLDGVDAFQALSDHVRDAHVEFGFPADRTSVVPNVLDERFERPHASGFESPYDLLYVGSLERHKGVGRLLPALARVHDRGIDARLTVVGDGGRRSAVERQARALGVEDAVTFGGRLPYADLPAVYAAHDLFVYPGEWAEPFGRVFVEALATGTPVVATDVGAAGQILGQAGVVTEGSAAGLADGVETAIRDRGLATLSERCGAELDPYRPGRVVDGIESLYADGPGGTGRRRGDGGEGDGGKENGRTDP